jgi:methylmalonyl-CoA/ethylmalonyl-CoA epimerase
MSSKLSFMKNGIAQIAFVVKDLEKTVENFYHIFGVGPWSFYTYKKPLLKEMNRNGKPTEYSMRIALANIGPMRIELIEQQTGDTVYQEFIDKHNYGIQHLGIVVDDIEEALESAKKANLKVTMDGSGFGLDGDGKYAYLDTEELIGTTLELISRPKNRVEPEKVYPS